MLLVWWLIHIRRSYSDDVSGLTYGGQTYETADGLVGGTLNVATVPISSGVTVSDTEVVLLSFH